MTAADKFLAEVLELAATEAQRDGSSAVEAHHLLLAIARADEPTTRRVLGSFGLDHISLVTSLDREFAGSLAAAGIKRPVLEVPARSSTPTALPLGTSLKVALERGVGSVGRKRDLRPLHVLLGIARARVGTVPRALSLAGVDPAVLAARVEQAIAENE